MIRAVQVYRVAIEVLVEAADPHEAQEKVEKAAATMDEGELWATELGAAMIDDDATRAWRRAHGMQAEDLRGWGDREDTRY